MPAVNHCLLAETSADGLVLIETGLGLADVRDPDGHTAGHARVAVRDGDPWELDHYVNSR